MSAQKISKVQLEPSITYIRFRWPKVEVETTNYAKLRPAMERSFGLLGIPENIVHDRGQLYNGLEWKNFGRKMEIKMVQCTPEHPLFNGVLERFNAVLVKIVHAAMAEGRDPSTEVQKHLLNYCNTTHIGIGYFPAELSLTV